MADAAPGSPCDHCDGRGWWASGCDGQVDCFQCQGTGVQRARGNCDLCLGWGWSIGAEPCAACGGTGWVDAPVALYWCLDCMRTVAVGVSGECPRGPIHAIERVTFAIRPPPT